jgi:hypothetical protein
MLRTRVIAVALILLVSISAPAADPMTPHRERINALRSEQGFHEIEEYCRQQLVRTALTNIERHELTLELAQTALENALRSPDDQARWETAQQTPILTLEILPENPRREQLRLQAGLAHLAHADALRPLFAETDEAWEPTRAALRQAIKQFRASREAIEVDARNAPRGAPRNLAESEIAPFTVQQLRSLDRHAAFLLAESYRRQAETYPADSGDRAHAAGQAEELYHTLADLENIVPQTWPSRVRLIGCHRLLDDHAAAMQAMTRCSDDALPAELRSSFRAESMRLFLAQRNLADALRVAASSTGEKPTLEEDLAILETHLAAAHDADSTAKPEVDLIGHIRQIGERWGANRRDQAAAFIARELSAGRLAGNADLWELAGDAHHRAARANDALHAFDQAQSLAEQANSVDLAMRAAAKAAAIDRAAGHFDKASARLRALSLAHPSHERAAPHHWLAIRDAAQAQVSEEDQRTLLREHLSNWPNGEFITTGRKLLADDDRNK